LAHRKRRKLQLHPQRVPKARSVVRLSSQQALSPHRSLSAPMNPPRPPDTRSTEALTCTVRGLRAEHPSLDRPIQSLPPILNRTSPLATSCRLIRGTETHAPSPGTLPPKRDHTAARPWRPQCLHFPSKQPATTSPSQSSQPSRTATTPSIGLTHAACVQLGPSMRPSLDNPCNSCCRP
jgi:hypothetical protein